MIRRMISSPTAVSYGSTTREIRYNEYPHSEGRAERSELCPGVDRSYFRGFGWTGTLHIVAKATRSEQHDVCSLPFEGAKKIEEYVASNDHDSGRHWRLPKATFKAVLS